MLSLLHLPSTLARTFTPSTATSLILACTFVCFMFSLKWWLQHIPPALRPAHNLLPALNSLPHITTAHLNTTSYTTNPTLSLIDPFQLLDLTTTHQQPASPSSPRHPSLSSAFSTLTLSQPIAKRKKKKSVRIAEDLNTTLTVPRWINKHLDQHSLPNGHVRWYGRDQIFDVENFDEEPYGRMQLKFPRTKHHSLVCWPEEVVDDDGDVFMGDGGLVEGFAELAL